MSYLLLFFAAVHLLLLLGSFSLERSSGRLWWLRCLLFGMAFDNMVQGLGIWFFDSSWYESANVMRFLLHALLLPLLVYFGVSTMQLAGVALASSKALQGFCTIFIVLALGYGFYHEVLLLELAPKTAYGVSKLVSTSGLPPVATILSNILVLPMAAAVWRIAKWPWFFLGALFIFLLNGATGAQPWGFISGNFAELIFVLSMLATERHFTRSSGARL